MANDKFFFEGKEYTKSCSFEKYHEIYFIGDSYAKNHFEYKDGKMIFIGSSKLDGDDYVTRYTEEFRAVISARAIEHIKKEYQKKRRHFRELNRGLEEYPFFKKHLDELKFNYQREVKMVEYRRW